MEALKMVKEYTLPILIHKEDDEYIAECPVFYVASQGNTMDDAIENVKEALELYLGDEDIQREMPEELPKYSFEEMVRRARELCLEYGGAEEKLPSYTCSKVNICVKLPSTSN